MLASGAATGQVCRFHGAPVQDTRRGWRLGSTKADRCIIRIVSLWNREAGDLLEDRLPVLAPLYAVITVQLTIPHATAIMTTATIARRRSESTSKSPTTRMLAKANTRATKNGVSTVTGPLDAIQHG